MAPSGCASCWGDDAGSAWRNRPALASVADIAEESHFSVHVLRCGRCGQGFASVFCETIDWIGGEDPQDWLLVPVTSAEAAALAAAGADGVEGALARLAPARRYLVRSYPRDAAAPETRWVDGLIWVPRHD